MRLTHYSDCALRMLMYLGADPARQATTAEIARACGIAEDHLTKIVHQLGRAGYVETTRGRKGGRPKTLEPAKRQLVVKLYTEKQHTIVEICRMMGISKPTLYNYLAEAGL